MKIFILLSRIPWPLEKGDKLRAFNQIKCLSQNNEIFLCALNDDKTVDKTTARQMLQPFCKQIDFIDLPKIGIIYNLCLSFIKGLPMQCGYFYNQKAYKNIQKLLKQIQPDVIFGQLVRVAPYIINQPFPKFIDYQDALSMGMKRRYELANFIQKPILKMEYHRLCKYESLIFDVFESKSIISDADRQLINCTDQSQIYIIPNGVDFEYYKPIETEKKYDIIFSGNMAYPPNIRAVEFLSNEIMPRIWNKLPQSKLCIAGATPDAKVKAAASDKIIVTGWVDDMRQMYAASRVFIAPMQIGTGLQNKLLEAMSMQLPCVTTPLANKALQGSPHEVLVGTSADELANHIIKLLTDCNFANEIAIAGNKFVKQTYTWQSANKIIEKAMQQAIEKFQSK